MKINLNNYEAYFLDYHEGSLSLDLVRELMEFLLQHPELRAEFESFEPITLKDTEEVAYEEKEALKKQLTGINASNFDEYAIEYIEGNLPAALQNELKAFVAQNPVYQQELELYAKTKLEADTSIVFEEKLSLKRGGRRTPAYYYWSAAAIVAVVISLYFLVNKNQIPTGNTIVNHNQAKDSNIVADHAVKAVDTNAIAPKNIPNTPANNNIKSAVTVIKKVQPKEQQSNEKSAPDNLPKDTSTIVVNKGTSVNNIVPVKKEVPVPDQKKSDSIAMNDNSNDDGWQVIQRPKKKKKEKALAQIAAITCQGLHTITGQHIELGKHYNSDTTNIVAYQLELGNKKFTFPVKE